MQNYNNSISLKTAFEAIGQKAYDFNGHTGFTLKISELRKLPIKKWSGNREPDMERVDEMVNLVTKSSMGYVPFHFHLALLDDEGLVVYDGNHRYIVSNKIDLPPDFNVFVDIMFHCNKLAVYKAFENINKAVQVPAVYFAEGDDMIYKIKDQINALVKEFEVKYKSHLSTSNKFRKPNFNRDVLNDNIFQIYQDLNKMVSIKDIGELLERLNTEYANGSLCKPHSNYSSTIINKCRENNCWLFLERTIPTEHVQQLIEY